MNIRRPGRLRIPQWAITRRKLIAEDVQINDSGVETGTVRTDLTGAIIRLVVRDSDDNVVLTKVSTDTAQIEIHADQVTEATKGTATIKFIESDTSGLNPEEEYYFDCWVTTQDGREEPIVDYGKFIVDKSSTHVSTF